MPAIELRSTMAYSQLVERVREWNLEFRLKEKYHTWALRPPLPKVAPQFHIMAEHALIAYILQNIAWAVSDLRLEQTAHHLHEMKSSYSKMSIGTSISSQTFNFSMILLVKSVAYFLSNHVKVVLVDLALECDIYRQTLLGLLGIEIEQNTYRILLKMFRSKRAIAKQRESVEIDLADENQPDGARTKTIQSIARRNGKHETAFFNRIADLGQERARLEEIKFLLKSNLYVKPAVQRPQPKYSIQQLKQRQQPQRQYSLVNIRRSRQSPQKFTIQANQLSHAFSSNSSLKLTDIKNHSIHCSHTRKISRPILPKETKKLEIRRQESRPEDRKGSKQIKNWTKIVTEMKEELYHHGKDSRLSEEITFDRFEKRFDFEPKSNQVKKIAPQSIAQTAEETFNFSKLNLKNSPNVIIYEGGSSEPNEEQPNDQPQQEYQIKVNYSRLNQSKKRENTIHSILPETPKA